MKKSINITMKISMYSNSCLFDTLSWIPFKITNSENIQKSKSAKAIFPKTWREKRENIEDMIRKN